MLFKRKPFVDTIKAMSPDGQLYFRDSTENGSFEVFCLKKSKSPMGQILMKGVFQIEDSNMFLNGAEGLGKPFFVESKDVLAALSGNESLVEYKNGVLDRVSVDILFASLDDDTPYHRLQDAIKYFSQDITPELSLSIPSGQHRIIVKNIKKFPSTDITRASMTGICVDFNASDDIRIVATDGRALIIYELPWKFDNGLSSMWTLSPDMLLVPPFEYESANYNFSKFVVSMTVRGKPDEPVITAYDIAYEWRDLKEERDSLKHEFESKKKTQQEVDEALKACIKKGSEHHPFPNYSRVVPHDNTQKIILDRDEITLGFQKLKPYLYKSPYQKASVFIIDVLDKDHPFLSSMKDIDNGGIDYIDTKLPLEKVDVSEPIRAVITLEAFEKCCLDGGDRIEIKVKNAKGAYLVEGVDFSKGHFVRVKKIFMPWSLPDSFTENGSNPKTDGQTDQETD